MPSRSAGRPFDQVIHFDLPEARFWIASGWPTNRPRCGVTGEGILNAKQVRLLQQPGLPGLVWSATYGP